jgi:hypothetical protein
MVEKTELEPLVPEVLVFNAAAVPPAPTVTV